MSFRLRVFALMALVAVIATGVTAWLTLRAATTQVSESAEAQRQTVETITAELADYGRDHGTWEGVATVVRELGDRTGERIKLTTTYGEVVADTDTLAGRAARATDAPPVVVDPRPELALPGDRPDVVAIASAELANYRTGVFLAACLTRIGIGVETTDGPYGVPRHVAAPAGEPGAVGGIEECQGRAATETPVGGDEWLSACPGVTADPAGQEVRVQVDPDTSAGTARDLRNCLTEAFAVQIDEFAPVPLQVYLGAAGDDDGAPLSAGPVLIAAGLVAALAIAGSILISRRVLRPIHALTGASHRLAAGDLTGRVPVAGRDELAALARSFNQMADSLQRGEERQRRLVADVAHELRTPLANLRGYLEALKDGVVTPDPELFTSLHEEAVLQQRIVDDLQDLALAEAGTMVYHRSRTDLGELLETCRTTHQAVAEAAGVRLSASTAGPVYVDADPDRLRQVLGNLVNNAIRATPDGGAVTLSGTRDGDWAVVTVTDTGTGIAPEHLPYVFDRFWRADAARGRTTGGSGLGLAIARQIVTDHEGTIEVASERGAGTTFSIRLPAISGTAAPDGYDRAATAPRQAPPGA